MAKLLALITLTALMALSEVSAYTTTITTTTTATRTGSNDEECSPTPIEKLGNCVGYLPQGIIDFNDKLRLRMVVNRNADLQEQEYSLSDCCSELKEVSENCRCNAINQVFDEARVKVTSLFDIRQLKGKAAALPFLCRFGTYYCPIFSSSA